MLFKLYAADRATSCDVFTVSIWLNYIKLNNGVDYQTVRLISRLL